MADETVITGMVFVVEMERMERFYAGLLGLRRVDDESQEGFVVLSDGDVRVALHALPDHVAAGIVVEDPPRAREAVAVKLLFAVADPEPVVERGLAAGGHVSHRADDGAVDLLDPEGNVLRVMPLG